MLDKFVADQEKVFEQREKKGLETLQERKRELEGKVEMHEKSVFFQARPLRFESLNRIWMRIGLIGWLAH